MTATGSSKELSQCFKHLSDVTKEMSGFKAKRQVLTFTHNQLTSLDRKASNLLAL